ncbi:MAG: GNAT family N-acetyltransferase [Gammaproteobacteria bacterium]|nr:GNAT family N-acetyltransferase [Gammaproteobacteria bacterium]
MTAPLPWVIEPLKTTHDRQGFTCGSEPLDTYLKKQSKQDVKRRISRVFIATTHDSPSTIVGYYTLSILSIELNELPKNIVRKLPKHPVPAALMGRLAVSEKAQGAGVGKMLLMDAIKRTLGVSNEIAIYAMVVDPISEQAKDFYQQYGFSIIGDRPRFSGKCYIAIIGDRPRFSGKCYITSIKTVVCPLLLPIIKLETLMDSGHYQSS